MGILELGSLSLRRLSLKLDLLSRGKEPTSPLFSPHSPRSPRSITTDMISPPMPPSPSSCVSGLDTLPFSVLPALEYISNALQRKHTHVTLIIGRPLPALLRPDDETSPSPHAGPSSRANADADSDLTILPAHPLSPAVWRLLHRVIGKASRRFALAGLDNTWPAALRRAERAASIAAAVATATAAAATVQAQTQIPTWTPEPSQVRVREEYEYLRCQSLLQNELLFSQEGLTLLSIDRLYSFKRRLHALSTPPHQPRTAASLHHLSSKTAYTPDTSKLLISSCVRLLRKTIEDFDGRPFSASFFSQVYAGLSYADPVLDQVATEYRHTFAGVDGIVRAPPPVFCPNNSHNNDCLDRNCRNNSKKDELDTERGIPLKLELELALDACNRLRPDQAQAPVRGGLGLGPSPGSAAATRTGTPHSAADVTPITRSEWNWLMFSQRRSRDSSIAGSASGSVSASALVAPAAEGREPGYGHGHGCWRDDLSMAEIHRPVPVRPIAC